MMCDITSGVPACDDCVAASCYAQCEACAMNSECLNLLGCLNDCYNYPYTGCEDDCSYFYPDGIADLTAFIGSTSGCVTSSCATECQ